MRPLSRYFDPERWRRLVAGQVELFRRRRSDDRLDAWLAQVGPISHAPGTGVVIADGMYFNPNHFFRLRLFLEALAACGERFDLLGVLRARGDNRARRALTRIGFTEFLTIEDDVEFGPGSLLGEADRLLAGVASHADLLRVELPHGMPAYVWYDTALKIAAHPQPAVDHPIWRRTLAEVLRHLAIYGRELSRRQVSHVVLSHPWKSEWGALVWVALQHRIPVYYITSHTEGLRVRRFRSTADYAEPAEHLPYAKYHALPAGARADLAATGYASFAQRASGQATDINARYAYRPHRRISDRDAARRALSGQTERPIIVILGHAWFDFPHAFGMSNFTDFLDWARVTLDTVRGCSDAIWLLKPHPTERWYRGFYMAQIVGNLPDHVRLLPIETDAATAFTAADAAVTVHGTGGLEAVAHGVPVIFADRSYFSDWALGYEATTRDHYVRLLGEAHRLAPPSREQRDRAAACFALAVGEPPPSVGALRISCDSLGSRLAAEIIDRWAGQRETIAAERDRLVRFLRQDDINSFAAYHLVSAALREAAAA
jgi:hypothetical protein